LLGLEDRVFLHSCRQWAQVVSPVDICAHCGRWTKFIFEFLFHFHVLFFKNKWPDEKFSKLYHSRHLK
jgi:hypothetical protein